MTSSETTNADSAERGLAEVRRKIDTLDEQIQALISERARLAAAVREAKGDLGSGSAYYRPDREAQVLRRVIERNEGPLSDAAILRLFREIMSACLAQQEPMRIAYLGPEGTFTQQAVYRQFGHSVNAIAQPSIEDVFLSVQGGEADFGVVPVENSTQGVVSHTLDLFMHSDLKIAAEVELRIHQHLLTQARRLDQIERVYAHQQSLAQCKHWLAAHLDHAELIAVSSNAEAARRVRNAPDSAAIAGRHAAEVYGLPVLFANIEDHVDNTTRFLVLGKSLLPSSGEDKTTLMVAGHDGPGALFGLLEPLARHHVNMNRIESRPSRQGRWDYVFFIDVDGHVDDPSLASAMEELAESARLVKVLGSYPRAVLGRLPDSAATETQS
ncbi:prephenate dehydratase [Wenzhouxiangella marina]|uniref:prephenate dehydratase n=1 Tax=Wenzhouxiangella marina TaxID=1579979 RepID=UPI0006738845|nr:prephenate dehydratase [Wenzhouxiangella marina]MBB6086542.1 chorismate mutase/prephenate dehydratase [Wenzhouxiangella marina]